ncbi:MAG: TolC family protein [Acidobacteria bacterium]|nr:MAG: TolC family protein [Acidobacteriota bacterium]
MKGISVIALGVLLSAPIASAQPAGPDTLPLTLEEAVRRAVENNPDLAGVRFGTQIEEARVSQSESAYTPVFSTIVGASSNVTPPSNFLLGERGVDTNDLFSSTGVRQRLARGAGTWNLSWDTSRTTSDSPLTSFDPSLQSGFQLAFSQPLLKDRKMDLARQQTIVSRRNLESAELRVRESVVQTTAAVKQAYWTLKATLANVTVQQRSLELAQELVRQNKARVDIGQTPPIDLLQAEAEVAQRRENLIRATAAAGDAEDHLRRLIMDPADVSFWRIHLNPTDEPMVGGGLPDVDTIAAGGFAARYDLARARKDLDNLATSVDFFNDQKLPDVRLETSFRSNGLGGTRFLRSGGFPGTITGTTNRGYGGVLGDMFGSTYPTWSVGLTVNYSLGRSFEEAGLARAQVERRQATQRIASLQLQIAETLRQAARQVHSTAQRIEAARAGESVAQQRLDVEQRRFEVGLSTSFLVTQAQRDLLQTEVNLLQATLDHQSALVSFEALQQAPALGGSGSESRGSNVVALPAGVPQGLFRPGAGSGF